MFQSSNLLKLTQIIVIEKRKKAKQNQRKHKQTKTKGSQFHTSAGLFSSVAILDTGKENCPFL